MVILDDWNVTLSGVSVNYNYAPASDSAVPWTNRRISGRESYLFYFMFDSCYFSYLPQRMRVTRWPRSWLIWTWRKCSMCDWHLTLFVLVLMAALFLFLLLFVLQHFLITIADVYDNFRASYKILAFLIFNGSLIFNFIYFSILLLWWFIADSHSNLYHAEVYHCC